MFNFKNLQFTEKYSIVLKVLGKIDTLFGKDNKYKELSENAVIGSSINFKINENFTFTFNVLGSNKIVTLDYSNLEYKVYIYNLIGNSYGKINSYVFDDTELNLCAETIISLLMSDFTNIQNNLIEKDTKSIDLLKLLSDEEIDGIYVLYERRFAPIKGDNYISKKTISKLYQIGYVTYRNYANGEHAVLTDEGIELYDFLTK